MPNPGPSGLQKCLSHSRQRASPPFIFLCPSDSPSSAWGFLGGQPGIEGLVRMKDCRPVRVLTHLTPHNRAPTLPAHMGN